MSNVSAVRPVCKPASGQCRWIARPDLDGNGIIEINGTSYALSELRDKGKLTGYHLLNLVNEKGYAIDTTWECWECDCPDYLFRRSGKDRHGCKHVASLKAALARIAPPAVDVKPAVIATRKLQRFECEFA